MFVSFHSGYISESVYPPTTPTEWTGDVSQTWSRWRDPPPPLSACLKTGPSEYQGGYGAEGRGPLWLRALCGEDRSLLFHDVHLRTQLRAVLRSLLRSPSWPGNDCCATSCFLSHTLWTWHLLHYTLLPISVCEITFNNVTYSMIFLVSYRKMIWTLFSFVIIECFIVIC